MIRPSDLLTGILIVTIAALFVVPVYPFLLDILITLNLGFSFILLAVSVFLTDVRALLSFPSVLLILALFRLGLNVASTRLILTSGQGGKVIEAFGTSLIRGEVLVGMIIFGIITVVNFLVIAKGATRVSEVAARFVLESLPGRQMNIEADLRSGLILPEDSLKARESLRQEAQLYGAMDGAMKFIQGDAMAGLIIVATNLLAGFYIGISDGMSLVDSVAAYTVLAVGDGLVSQVPSLLTSLCAAIIVTRVGSSKPETLGQDVLNQVFTNPRISLLVGYTFIAFGFLPFLPLIPFALVGGILVILSIPEKSKIKLREQMLIPLALGKAKKRKDIVTKPSSLQTPERNKALLPTPTQVNQKTDLRIVVFDTKAIGNLERVARYWETLRSEIYDDFGINLPDFNFENNAKFTKSEYRVYFKDALIFEGMLDWKSILVELAPEFAPLYGLKIDKTQIFPIGGARTFWTSKDDFALKILKEAGTPLKEPAQFLLLKVATFFCDNPEEILNISEIHQKLKELDKKFPGLVNEALDKNLIDISRLTEVAQELVRDGLGIKDFRRVIEGVANYCSHHRNMLAEEDDFDRGHLVAFIRIQERRQLLKSLISYRRTLRVVNLASEVEEIFFSVPVDSSHFVPLGLEPQVLEQLIYGINRVVDPVFAYGVTPICVICKSDLRSRVSLFLRTANIPVKAIAFEEVLANIEVEEVGMWKIED